MEPAAGYGGGRTRARERASERARDAWPSTLRCSRCSCVRPIDGNADRRNGMEWGHEKARFRFESATFSALNTHARESRPIAGKPLSAVFQRQRAYLSIPGGRFSPECDIGRMAAEAALRAKCAQILSESSVIQYVYLSQGRSHACGSNGA